VLLNTDLKVGAITEVLVEECGDVAGNHLMFLQIIAFFLKPIHKLLSNPRDDLCKLCF
jgi:hypothetical protein